ncbi:hypothetical protein ABK040_013943 [Willaertia magna]
MARQGDKDFPFKPSSSLYSDDEDDETLMSTPMNRTVNYSQRSILTSLTPYSNNEDEDNERMEDETKASNKDDDEDEINTNNNNMEDDEREETSLENPIILSLTYQKGRLGVASFDSRNGELLCGETNENNLFEAMEFVKFEVKPTLIVVPSKTEQSFLKYVKKPIEGQVGEIEVKLLKSSDFYFDNSIKKIQILENVLLGTTSATNDINNINNTKSIREKEGTSFLQTSDTAVAGERSFISNSSSNNKLSFMQQRQHSREVSEKNSYLFDFSSIHMEENHQMVRAIGGLLNYIQMNRLLFGELDDLEILKNIRTVKNFKFDGFVQMDINTLKALSIFKMESHPCHSMAIGRPKEGLSLFGIMNKTKSVVGKELLRQWFLKPVMDIEVLRGRYTAIEYFMQFSSDFNEELRENLKYMKNTKRILKRMREAKASVNDWTNLWKSLYCCKTIFEILVEGNAEDKIDIVKDIYNGFGGNIMRVLEAISKVIDFNESKTNNRVTVSPGVNRNLDKLRETYDSLDNFLTLVAEQEIVSFPEGFYEFSVVYLPQIGFLLSFAKNEETENQSNMEQFGLQFHFTTDKCVYYKNHTVRELDESIGDIHHIIIDTETEIIVKLERFVLNYETDINKLNDAMAKLDCILSMVFCACEMNFTKPELSSEPILDIKEGRNPLQELTVDTFIANDTFLNGGIQIVTGANNSGKSCYLKQVGLIVFLAHIGSFVPASSAKIGIVDRIMTRIQSQDSISVNQSSFAIDLLQIKAMVDYASPKSLLLIDEFGKGTLALDGVALLSSVLKHFLKKDETPRLFVTTHYVEILQYKLVDIKNPKLQFMTMDVLIDKVNQNQTETEDDSSMRDEDKPVFDFPNADDLVFLYKLVPGKIIPSYGITAASLAGIPNHIINRSKFVAERMAKSLPIEGTENEKTKLFHTIFQKFKSTTATDESK